MKLTFKNIKNMRWVNKENKWRDLILKYFELLSEEIPGILAIIFFPSFFGFWILIPNWKIVIAIISILLLMRYLKIKGEKNYKKFANDIRWDLINLIASLILGLAISIIIGVCYTNQFLNLKSILPILNKN